MPPSLIPTICGYSFNTHNRYEHDPVVVSQEGLLAVPLNLWSLQKTEQLNRNWNWTINK